MRWSELESRAEWDNLQMSQKVVVCATAPEEQMEQVLGTPQLSHPCRYRHHEA
jgi:hypothetical protein